MRQYTNHHWFTQWLIAWPAPSYYLNQCWNIVSWTLRNKLQWHDHMLKFSFATYRPFCTGLGEISTCPYYDVLITFHKSAWYMYGRLQYDVIECVVCVWNVVNTWKCSSSYGSMKIRCITPFHLHALNGGYSVIAHNGLTKVTVEIYSRFGEYV